MKKTEFFRAAPAAVLFALSLAPAATGVAAGPLAVLEPTPAVETILVVGTDDQQSIAIRRDTANEAREVLVVEAPRHGYLELEPGAVFYQPAGYVGRDSLALAMDGTTVYVELRILPRFIAFAGRFDGVDETVALWDNQSRAFQVCSALAQGQSQLTCNWLPVSGLPAGTFIPLAWPNPSEDSPVLFQVETGTFRYLELDGAAYVAGGTLDMQSFPGGWPIFGDFVGSGTKEPAMVDGNGNVFLWSGKGWESWPVFELDVPPGDGLVWPLVLPRQNGDAVALIDKATGEVHWMRLDASGLDFGVRDENSGVPDFGRPPLVWSQSGLNGVSASFPIFFLENLGNSLRLRAGHYDPGHPTIIPVKFPDDPPLGGGGGG